MFILLLLLHFVNIVAAAVLAGGQLCVLLVIVPTKRKFATPTSVEVHNAMLGHQIDGYMKPTGIIGALAATSILVLSFENLSHAAIAFIGVELMAFLGVLITSRFFNVKTNAMMADWSLDAIPGDYAKIRARWDRVHAIRTCCGCLVLAAAVSVLLAQAQISRSHAAAGSLAFPQTATNE